METFSQDIRYAIRVLAKNPAFTAVAVITLALGIGANSAIFSVVNAVLLRPLPYEESDRLVLITERSPVLEGMSIAYPNFLDWRDQNSVFDHIAVFRQRSFNLTGDGEPERIIGGEVSADLFNALKVSAAIGRTFLPEEDQPGGTPVAVLSHGFWQRRYGADPNLLGQPITLSGKAHTVVGIMPASFRFRRPADLWVPVGQLAGEPSWNRGNHPGLYGVGRLKPGVTIEQARADMDAIAAALEEQYPQSNSGNRVSLTPLLESVVGDIRPALIVLLSAVGFVLLIACANVANLLLARAAARQKEMAIRTALGASRLRVMRQLLTESVLLSLIGGALGLLVGLWGTTAIGAISPDSIPRFAEIGVDTRVLGFTAGVSIVTGILFGLAPALQSSRINLNEMLKESGRGATAGFRRQRIRSLLVVSEVAIALILLVSAGLLIKSFLRLQQVDPGFNPNNVLTVGVSLPVSKYREPAKRFAFYEQLIPRIEAIPGVEVAGMVSELPIEGGSQTFFVVEGQPVPSREQTPLTEYSAVWPGYFKAMGIRLLRGREITEQDKRDAPSVVIIDETFANRYWPGEDPLGKRIRLGGADSGAPWSTVIGVAGNVKYQGLDVESPRVQIYIPFRQNAWLSSSLAVRTADSPTGITESVRRAVLEVDSDLPVFNVRTMNDILTESVAPRRLYMLLLGVFAGVAIVLAAVGLYGVLAYSVTQRTHEIGIRMALGAQSSDVLRLVVRQGMALALVGAGIGLAAAFITTRFLSSLLFGVSATDPTTFATVSLLLIGVALVACFIPALRATRLDPMIALRHE